MKKRNGFVSNSSSTAFVITNTSDKEKTLEDFIRENDDLVDQFNNEFDWHNYKKEEAFESAADRRLSFPPKTSEIHY